jgi:hypothetical protein
MGLRAPDPPEILRPVIWNQGEAARAEGGDCAPQNHGEAAKAGGTRGPLFCSARTWNLWSQGEGWVSRAFDPPEILAGCFFGILAERLFVRCL